MKNGKKPTREQRKTIKAMGLNSENWLVAKDTPEAMTLIHRYIPGQTRVMPKG